jgi:hypothetical protein
MGQARRPPEPRSVQETDTRARSSNGGYPARGPRANLNHGLQRSKCERRRQAARHHNSAPSRRGPPPEHRERPQPPATRAQPAAGGDPVFASHGSTAQRRMISKSAIRRRELTTAAHRSGDLVLSERHAYGGGLIVLLGPRLAQLWGLSFSPGGAHGHHDLVRCPCPGDAGVQQHRAAGVSRVPGRVQRPDPPGLRVGPASVRQLVPTAPAAPVRRPPRRHRVLRTGPGNPRQSPRHHHPAAVHSRRALPVCGRGRTARPLARRARAPAQAGLRIPRHRPGPQRARRFASRCRARASCGACADLAAGPQRAAGLRGHRRGHRGPRHRARTSHAGDYPQGWQGRHHPAGAAHRAGDRPGRRRAQPGPDLPFC